MSEKLIYNNKEYDMSDIGQLKYDIAADYDIDFDSGRVKEIIDELPRKPIFKPNITLKELIKSKIEYYGVTEAAVEFVVSEFLKTNVISILESIRHGDYDKMLEYCPEGCRTHGVDYNTPKQFDNLDFRDELSWVIKSRLKDKCIEKLYDELLQI